MFNLAEYRHRAQSLADFLPWAALVGEGVILNKDGSFQRSARFRGPDLDSATPAELVAASRVWVRAKAEAGFALIEEPIPAEDLAAVHAVEGLLDVAQPDGLGVTRGERGLGLGQNTGAQPADRLAAQADQRGRQEVSADAPAEPEPRTVAPASPPRVR